MDEGLNLGRFKTTHYRSIDGFLISKNSSLILEDKVIRILLGLKLSPLNRWFLNLSTFK